jgi:hypothetical protein
LFPDPGRVFYNTLEATEDAVRGLNPTHLSAFESSCFSGQYVTPEVTRAYLREVEARRGGCGGSEAGGEGSGDSVCSDAAAEDAAPAKAARCAVQGAHNKDRGCEGLHNSV